MKRNSKSSEWHVSGLSKSFVIELLKFTQKMASRGFHSFALFDRILWTRISRYFHLRNVFLKSQLTLQTQFNWFLTIFVFWFPLKKSLVVPMASTHWNDAIDKVKQFIKINRTTKLINKPNYIRRIKIIMFNVEQKY